jgi:hypothetical protein
VASLVLDQIAVGPVQHSGQRSQGYASLLAGPSEGGT